MVRSLAAVVIVSASLIGASSFSASSGQMSDWPHYNSDPGNSHFSRMDQINRSNVARLEKIWEFDAGTLGGELGSLQFNPLIVGGTAFLRSGDGGIAAVDAATGKQIWRQVPDADDPMGNSRGATIWRNPADPTDLRLFFTSKWLLHALDARTGKSIGEFGTNGHIDMGVPVTSPGVVFEDLIILGSTGGARGPGQIRAYDVYTGRLRWAFQTIPRGPEDAGYDSWGADGAKYAMGANNWGGMAVDRGRGIVYASTAQPKTRSIGLEFFNGGWPGRNRFADSVIAIDASNGKLVWDFQETHHDVWDYDIPAPPNLVRVRFAGREVDAVAQVTKRGNILLLNRDTGKLLYPAEERAAPRSSVREETTYPTQPFFTRPQPFSKIEVTESDLTMRTSAAHAHALRQFRRLRSGWMQPPSVEGTLSFGLGGGAEWGGAAFDPRAHMLYVTSNHLAMIIRLNKDRSSPFPPSSLPVNSRAARQVDEGHKLFAQHCAVCHSGDRQRGTVPDLSGIGARASEQAIYEIVTKGRALMPSFETALSSEQRRALALFLFEQKNARATAAAEGYASLYSFTYEWFLDQDGYPGTKPPWATLNAINLDKGAIVWSVPVDQHKEMVQRGMPPGGYWGQHSGAVATAGDLVFVAQTALENRLLAFDGRNGRLLWQTILPGAPHATPSTYAVDGRQFLLVAVDGPAKSSRRGRYIAYALKASN